MGMWVCFVWEVLIVFVRFFAGFFFVSKLSDVHIFFSFCRDGYDMRGCRL